MISFFLETTFSSVRILAFYRFSGCLNRLSPHSRLFVVCFGQKHALFHKDDDTGEKE